ncbi:MAG: cob(I)yrinic acid a,c-diamide adenosyltransferase [Phycisphaeraceae bacterium]|nr:cob(I)yrinic acid a,c-diamide adenosyltransferase [Phycisphaeraceae bacterium]
MKLYTRRGDDGQTDLFGGKRVSKTDLRIGACGSVDELNCMLGVTIAFCNPQSMRQILLQLQHELFELGADLATPLDAKIKISRVAQTHIDALEKFIDQATGQTQPMTCFILPGGCELAARLHLSRAICRRAERDAVDATTSIELNPMAVTYLNRLSDLLFAMARWANVIEGVADVPWEQKG